VNGTAIIGAGQAIEVNRKVNKDGNVQIANTQVLVGFAHAGRKVVLRLDGAARIVPRRVGHLGHGCF
jgi:hypothetical protein